MKSRTHVCRRYLVSSNCIFVCDWFCYAEQTCAWCWIICPGPTDLVFGLAVLINWISRPNPARPVDFLAQHILLTLHQILVTIFQSHECEKLILYETSQTADVVRKLKCASLAYLKFWTLNVALVDLAQLWSFIFHFGPALLTNLFSRPGPCTGLLHRGKLSV